MTTAIDVKDLAVDSAGMMEHGPELTPPVKVKLTLNFSFFQSMVNNMTASISSCHMS